MSIDTERLIETIVSTKSLLRKQIPNYA